MFIGHKSTDGRLQPLQDHLRGVSDRAKAFAQPFSAEEHAARTGLLHDAGKYSEAGQRRMNDPEHIAKVDHSTAGSKIALEQFRDLFGASAIAGHHGGMPDVGRKRAATESDGTLFGRCTKDLSGTMDPSAFWKENSIAPNEVIPAWLLKERNPFAGVFYTHMLFSSLVDADFLDTEAFMQTDPVQRGQYESIEALLDKLTERILPLLSSPSSELNKKRCQILENCLASARQEPGLFSLTVPTGGGKTISSLAFALNHAAKYNKKRVIYVIPYTSIIEQNAQVFREIVGEHNVLEHHSGVDADETEDLEKNELIRRKLLAAENWDAPLIVTTAVQFFESLFSNKPAKCRKLHNIADSVIIFDEAQMLPLDFLKPCVWAIAELVRHYSTTCVLCTATQPSLNTLIAEYDPALHVREISQDIPELQAFFRRVHFKKMGTLSLDTLADELTRQRQTLCIVNTRKNAQLLFKKLPAEGSFHLSTRMPAEHRSIVLNEIRERLKQGQSCRVISTSLLEAGVDLDFPQVWREKAGLDSILQAAGRCNREGKRTPAESEVVLFSLPDAMPKGIEQNAMAAEIAMEDADHPDESPVITAYFDQLYRLRGAKALDSKKVLDLCSSFSFESIAKVFHLINSDTCTIYIPRFAKAEDISALQAGKYSRSLMRRLGRCSVNIYKWEWEHMLKCGNIQPIDETSAVLIHEQAYDMQCGLIMDPNTGIALFES